MIRNLLNLLLLLIFLGFYISGHSQSIDTTKFYVLTNTVVGEKLAVTGMVDATLGNIVMLRGAIDHPMQQWIIEKGQVGYRLYCREHGRGYSLEVVNEGSNSSKVSLGKTIEGSSGQTWRINRNPDGSYRLISLWQNKAIDYVKSGDKMNTLTLSEIESSIKSQTWRLVGIPKPIAVVPKKATPYAVVLNAPVEQTKKEVAKAETKSVLDTAAVYQIMTDEVPDKSLGIGTIDGRIEQALLVPSGTNLSRQWKISFKGNGLYQITSQRDNSKSLEVRKDGVEDEIVMMAPTSKTTEQLWKIVRAPDGNYQITSAAQDGSKSFDFVEDDEVRHEIRMRGFNSTLWSFMSRSATPAAAQQPVAVTAPANKNKLMPGEQLKVNQKIFSANGEFSLVQQGDGNLVVNNSQSEAIWGSGLGGQMARRTVMQEDGNFTQHPDGYNSVLWSTQTKGNSGAYALLRDDGVLAVVNSNNQIIWRSVATKPVANTRAEVAKKEEQVIPVELAPTITRAAEVNNRLVANQELRPSNSITSANGKYKLIQQGDGNLVVYQSNRPTWTTGTNGKKTQRCVMQKDGNLVLYDIFKSAVWASNTHGNENAYLILNDDGVLEIFNKDNQVIWRSKN